MKSLLSNYKTTSPFSSPSFIWQRNFPSYFSESLHNNTNRIRQTKWFYSLGRYSQGKIWTTTTTKYHKNNKYFRIRYNRNKSLHEQVEKANDIQENRWRTNDIKGTGNAFAWARHQFSSCHTTKLNPESNDLLPRHPERDLPLTVGHRSYYTYRLLL